MTRGVLIAVLFLITVSTVLAGTFSSTVTTSTSGSTATVKWGQGCAAQPLTIQGRTITTDPAGPNACATYGGQYVKPYMCSVDSAGGTSGTSKLVPYCDGCGCLTGYSCNPSRGSCEACLDTLCQCQTGQLCDEHYTGAPGCATAGGCYWGPVDFSIHLWMNQCAFFCWSVGDWRGAGTLYDKGQTADYTLTYYVAGSAACNESVRVTDTGDDVTCRVLPTSWGNCNKGVECHSNTANVKIKASDTFGAVYQYVQVPVTRGTTATTPIIARPSIFTSGSTTLKVVRSTSGSDTCSVNPADTASGVHFRVMECQ